MPILSPLVPAPTQPGLPEQLSCVSLRWRDLLLGHDSPYIVHGIEGWEDLPPARVDRVGRPRAHGSFASDTWSDERVVTVTGTCGSSNDRDALLADLQARFGYGVGEEDLTVTMLGRTLTAQAQLVRFAPEVLLGQWPAGRFPWAAQWRCPDPLRYGPVVTVSTGLPSPGGGLSYPLSYPLSYGDPGDLGTVQLENPGTADAWPVFTVVGPLPSGFEVSSAGRRIVYAAEVPAGGTVLLDSSDGSVLREGAADRRGDVTVAEWFSVPANGSITVQFTSLGGFDAAASLSASVRPAYW